NRVYDIVNYSGVQMLIFLAGLQSISPSIYEACQIEGATSWETFWKITFPMISPMILVNGIYTIIDSFTKSDNIVMSFINGNLSSITPSVRAVGNAQAWMYFAMILLVIAAFAGIASLFVFYQKRD
ncbi:MAG: carbohydrate ABC transporter permease, partial [Eubacteriales bacterium]